MQFNQELFNQKNFFWGKIRKGVSFAGMDFTSMDCGRQTNGVMIQKINAFDLNNIEIASTTSNYGDGGRILQKAYQPKTLTLTLFIQAENHTDLVRRIDEIKQKTQVVEWSLDIMIWEEIRRYTATVSSITVPSFSWNDDFLEGLEIEFLITSPHWYSPDFAQTAIADVSANISRVVENTGSYKSFPTIYLVGKENCHISSFSVSHKKIWQVGEGYSISISENISAGQVICLNYEEKIATKDGVEIPFTGIMMPMSEWQSVFDFSFEWSPQVNIFVLHKPTFL